MEDHNGVYLSDRQASQIRQILSAGGKIRQIDGINQAGRVRLCYTIGEIWFNESIDEWGSAGDRTIVRSDPDTN